MSTLPSEILVAPNQKLVYVTPEVSSVMPEATTAFETVDQNFVSDPEATLCQLQESIFSFESSTGADIACSLIPGKGSELLIMWAPFSDGAPSSDAQTMYRYISGDKVSKTTAAPNSWNQITKSGVVAELLKATGSEMPVLTIFSPLPSFPNGSYTGDEYRQIRRGDFTPAARVTAEAIKHAQDRLHGSKAETQMDSLHLHGASLGASTAVGAANGLLRTSNIAVRSVTAQELIVAPRNVTLDLAARFTVKSVVGGISEIAVDDSWQSIDEPLIRQQIDGNGNEPMMFTRMLHGMSKLSRLKGLTRPHRNVTPHLIESLAAAGVNVTVPLAENSGLTHDTAKYLLDAGEHVVNIRAVQGERVGHLIDEHVGATVLLAVMNVHQNA